MLANDYDHCTGCSACIQICPQHCIEWIDGEFGFSYPRVNTELCINCGKCESVCQINKEIRLNDNAIVYAAKNNNRKVLEESTSGGLFYSFASVILDQLGVVYGCEMGPDFKVHHTRIEKREEIIYLQGSKYVQSDTSQIYTKVRTDLKNGKKVLFSGTPCQIAGLKLFLNKEYNGLYTIDIVCHGVCSQKLFDKYIDYFRETKGNPISVRFRDKKYVGWSCGGVLEYIDKKRKKEKEEPFYNYDNFYYKYFLSGATYRKACYSCQFARENRIGDISLGDYWGAEAINLPFEVDRGCSLLFINSEKGNELFSMLVDISYAETPLTVAKKRNEQLNHPAKLLNERAALAKQYETDSGLQLQKTYLRNNIVFLLKGKMKSMLPYNFKLLLRGKGLKG